MNSDKTTKPGWIECYNQFDPDALKGRWYQCVLSRLTRDGKLEVTIGPVVFPHKEINDVPE